MAQPVSRTQSILCMFCYTFLVLEQIETTSSWSFLLTHIMEPVYSVQQYIRVIYIYYQSNKSYIGIYMST